MTRAVCLKEHVKSSVVQPIMLHRLSVAWTDNTLACLAEKLTWLDKFDPSFASVRTYTNHDCHCFTGKATSGVDESIESGHAHVAPGLVHASTLGPDAELRVVTLNRVEAGLSVEAAQHVKQVFQHHQPVVGPTLQETCASPACKDAFWLTSMTD